MSHVALKKAGAWPAFIRLFYSGMRSNRAASVRAAELLGHLAEIIM
jgi:hypothetical protein